MPCLRSQRAVLTLALAAASCAAAPPAPPPTAAAPAATTPATPTAPPSSIAVAPSVAQPSSRSPSTSVADVLAALDGVCERTWAMVDGVEEVGCRDCREPGVGASARIGDEAPARRVAKWFEASLFGTGKNVVLSYEGCVPGIWGGVGTMLVDTSTHRVVRDDPGLSLTRCAPAPRDAREVLVCTTALAHQRMTAGTVDHVVGVYDPVDLRAVAEDDATDSEAWHAIPLFSSDAAYHCAAGGSPPGALVRRGAVTALDVEVLKAGARVRITGTFAKRRPTTAFRTACEADTDLDTVLGVAPFTLELSLRAGRLVPTPAAATWIAKAR